MPPMPAGERRVARFGVAAGLLLATTTCVTHPVAGSDGTVASAYTALTGQACKVTVDPAVEDQSVQQCPGFNGYKLLVLDADNRMSVTVVAPDGKAFPLRYWDVITPHFSHLGAKAEWRIQRSAGSPRPTGLIVRVIANEDPELAKETAYLAIAKITAAEICVTARVPDGDDANARARLLADHAVAAPCLQARDQP